MTSQSSVHAGTTVSKMPAAAESFINKSWTSLELCNWIRVTFKYRTRGRCQPVTFVCREVYWSLECGTIVYSRILFDCHSIAVVGKCDLWRRHTSTSCVLLVQEFVPPNVFPYTMQFDCLIKGLQVLHLHTSLAMGSAQPRPMVYIIWDGEQSFYLLQPLSWYFGYSSFSMMAMAVFLMWQWIGPSLGCQSLCDSHSMWWVCNVLLETHWNSTRVAHGTASDDAIHDACFHMQACCIHWWKWLLTM